MKKVIFAMLLTTAAFPAMAQDAERVAPYIALKGGVSWQRFDYSIGNRDESFKDYSYQGRVAVGMAVMRSMRAEVEASLYKESTDKLRYANADLADLKLNLQTYLLNVYYDLGRYNHVQPYIGIGAGVARTKLKGSTTIGGTEIDLKTKSDTRFTAMGTVGIAVSINEHIALDIGARYNYIDFQEDMHMLGADVGVRISF